MLPYSVVKWMLIEITKNDPGSPRNASSLKWVKDDRTGGRKDRKIETQREALEGRMVNRKHDEHREFSTKENDFISKKTSPSRLQLSLL